MAFDVYRTTKTRKSHRMRRTALLVSSMGVPYLRDCDGQSFRSRLGQARFSHSSEPNR